MLELNIVCGDFPLEGCSDSFRIALKSIFKGENAKINGLDAVTLEGDGENVEVIPDEDDQSKLHIHLKENAYSSLKKKGDDFFEVHYDKLDYDYADKYFNDRAPAAIAGGCSVLAAGNLVGRNYDWHRNGDAIFELHTPAAQGHYAACGIAGSLSMLSSDFVESREYDDAYRILPFYLEDGVNEKGLFAAILVVPATGNSVTVPAVEKRDRVCSVALVRYILDNYASVEEAVSSLRNYIEIFHPTTLTEMGYEPHFFLKDANSSVVLEFTGTTLVAVSSNKCTNFHVNGVTINEDGSVWTNADVLNGHLPSSHGIENYGSGLERWNILNAVNVTDQTSMREAINSVLFSKAYTDDDNVWFSEFVGGSITVDTPSDDAALLNRIARYRQKYQDSADPDIWITKQSCVYDIAAAECSVIVQESGEEYTFSLMEKSSNNYNWLENKPRINGHTLQGNKTAEQLGLQPTDYILNPYQTISEETYIEACEAVASGKRLVIEVPNPDTGYGSLLIVADDVDREAAADYLLKFSVRNGLTIDNFTIGNTGGGAEIVVDSTALQGQIDDLDEIRDNAQAGAAIVPLVPAQASPTNQIADKDFVNSSIQNVAAYYITKDAAGNPFATKAELTAATVFYSGGQVRVPTRNDYLVVLADESKTIAETGENPTTRYIYDNNVWSYQYIVNRSGLTAAQWAAVTSGITMALVGKLGALPTAAELSTLLFGKVDKDAGKGLSTNDYDNTEKTKVAGAEQTSNKTTSLSSSSTDTQYPSAKATYDALAGKVDKVTGKGLSTNDYDNTEKTKVAGAEQTSNRQSVIPANPDNTHYPTSRATYDAINPAKQSAIPAGGMLSNVLYDLGELSGAVSMTLAEIVDSAIPNHFFCTFETGANMSSLIWDASITKWYCPFNEAKQPGTKNQAPILSPNKHYEISVIDGAAVAMEV